jgi:hypothetical protein
MVKDATYTFLCWVLGFLATARTDWAVQQALKLQHRYPKALTVFDVIVALR